MMYLLDAMMIPVLWWNHRKQLPGIGSWVIASMVLVLASLLIGLRGRIPLYGSYVVAITLYLVGFLFLLEGFRSMENASKVFRWNFGWILLFANSALTFLYSHRNDQALTPGLPRLLIGFIQLYITAGMVTGIVLQINSKLLECSRNAEKSLRRMHENLQAEKDQKENPVIRYSKMAMPGEMMSAISHQWKQPANAISPVAGNLRTDSSYDKDHGCFSEFLSSRCG